MKWILPYNMFEGNKPNTNIERRRLSDLNKDIFKDYVSIVTEAEIKIHQLLDCFSVSTNCGLAENACEKEIEDLNDLVINVDIWSSPYIPSTRKTWNRGNTGKNSIFNPIMKILFPNIDKSYFNVHLDYVHVGTANDKSKMNLDDHTIEQGCYINFSNNSEFKDHEFKMSYLYNLPRTKEEALKNIIKSYIATFKDRICYDISTQDKGTAVPIKHRNIGKPFVNTIIRYCEFLLVNANFNMNEKPNEILYKIFFEEISSMPNIITLLQKLKENDIKLYKKLTKYADPAFLKSATNMGEMGF